MHVLTEVPLNQIPRTFDKVPHIQHTEKLGDPSNHDVFDINILIDLVNSSSTNIEFLWLRLSTLFSRIHYYMASKFEVFQVARALELLHGPHPEVANDIFNHPWYRAIYES